jgi:hypothetical protein
MLKLLILQFPISSSISAADSCQQSVIIIIIIIIKHVLSLLHVPSHMYLLFFTLSEARDKDGTF